MTTKDTKSGNGLAFNEILKRLEHYYSADEITAWLNTPQPQLDGACAIDLINQGEPEKVLRVLERMDGGVYL